MVFEELNIVLFFDNHFFDINYAKFHEADVVF